MSNCFYQGKKRKKSSISLAKCYAYQSEAFLYLPETHFIFVIAMDPYVKKGDYEALTMCFFLKEL